VQDYQQIRKTSGASGQMSSGAPSTQTSSLFGTPAATQQPRTGSIFGVGTAGAFGATTSQPAMGAFGATGPQRSATGIFTGGSAFGKPQVTTMSGNLGTSNTGTSAFTSSFTFPYFLCHSGATMTFSCYLLGAFGQNTATSSTASTFSFATPKPAFGSSSFGGGTSAFGGSGSANGGTFAAGTSRTDAFGATAPSTGSAFGGGSPLFGQPAASGALFASTYKTSSQFIYSNNKYRCHSTTHDDRHICTSLFCLQRGGSFEPEYHPSLQFYHSHSSL
jgi:hypothetical protein